MLNRLPITAAAALMLSVAAAAAAELPSYEVTGFPATPHQLSTLGAAGAEQSVPVVTATVSGMPASPNQIAVLTPRRSVVEAPRASGDRRATGEARLSPVVASRQSR